MRKITLIGQTGCGKTTLCQYFHNMTLQYKKTQQVEFFQDSIDTPGEFLENRFLYNALINTANDSEYVGFVQNIENSTSSFPPCFAASFSKPVIGIISKIDQAKDCSQIEQSEKMLLLAGAKQIFKVSAVTGEGVSELLDSLDIKKTQ